MAKLLKKKLPGFISIVFLASILLITFFVKIPLAATCILSLFLIISASVIFGIKGSLPAIFYSTGVFFYANYSLNMILNPTISIIVIAGYFLSGISLAITIEFFIKKKKILLFELEKIKNDMLSLSSRNDLLEKIIAGIPAFVYVKDINLKYLSVNAAFENIMGKKTKDLIGKTDYYFFPESIAKKMAEDEMEVINKDCPKLELEENNILPDGRNIWLNTNMIPLHDENGKVCGIIGISIDITEIKKVNIQMNSILSGFPYKAWLKDKEGRFLAVNELSKSIKEMIGKTDLDILPEEYAKSFREDEFAIMKQKKPRLFEELTYSYNLLKLHETYKAPVINEAGEVIGTTGYARDISEIQKSLFESKKQISFFNSVIDNIPIMLFLKDAKELRFKMVNKAAEDLMGLSREDILGKTDYEVFPKNQADFFVKKDREALSNKNSIFIEEEKIASKDKTIIISTKKMPILDENNEPVYILGISENITEKRQLEKTIKKLAYFDEITGLPNRTLFKDRFQIAAERARRENKKMMIVMLDFDKFKLINDKYGHGTGDKLLKSFAARLKKVIRKADTIARFGGDEFLMVLGDFSNREDMEKFAKKVINVFKEPFKIEKFELSISGSAGISVFPDDSLNHSDLIKFADAAMYEAKTDGGNNYKFYRSIRQNKLVLDYNK
ncbi:MAG: diguanylate cyclase [Actinobacteria bacterium]|nr:diguanylate cyclase [Actinomycetota bacterium]